MVVTQDVRGRYCSEGERGRLPHERDDGYNSVEWAAKLPGANGWVGMFGGSYVGATQWASWVAGAPSDSCPWSETSRLGRGDDG